MEQVLGAAEKPVKHPFPAGTKYMFLDQVWFVKKAWQDNGTQFRYVQSHTSGEENYMELHTLQKDSESPDFVFMEPTDQEKLMMKALKPR